METNTNTNTNPEDEEEDIFSLFTCNTRTGTIHNPNHSLSPSIDDLLFGSNSASVEQQQPVNVSDPFFFDSQSFLPVPRQQNPSVSVSDQLFFDSDISESVPRHQQLPVQSVSDRFFYDLDSSEPVQQQQKTVQQTVSVSDQLFYDSDSPEPLPRQQQRPVQLVSGPLFDDSNYSEAVTRQQQPVSDQFFFDSDLSEPVPRQQNPVQPVQKPQGSVSDQLFFDSNYSEPVEPVEPVQFDSDSSEQVPRQQKPVQPVRVFDRFFYDSDSSSENTNHVETSLDNMIRVLDTDLILSSDEESHDEKLGLAEFVSGSGGSGVFRVPARAATNSERPPCLELRPRPLRESQARKYLRSLTSLSLDQDYELWAGTECGVRFWDLSRIYEEGEEEGAAPFWTSVQTAPVTCVVADAGAGVIWSGHTDGKIRCWKICSRVSGSANNSGSPFRESFSWQAHRAPVLSIVITACGDLWSGSEGGVIMIWPWESIEKALSLTVEERHLASLTVERSYIDLRNQTHVNFSNFTSDIKYMLSDHSSGRVWTAGYTMFALWDSRTRELLKVFNMDGQIENLPFAQDPMEDDSTLNYLSISRKERQQTPLSFFQRSRNALFGAADAVRRVAVKGPFGDDYRRIEALISTIDGLIWCGCANGMIVQWDGNGNRLQDFQYHSFSVQCLTTLGSRIWVGYSSGVIQVLDLNGNLIGDWVAHNNPIIDICFGYGYIFSLANHGGIRGWHISSPGPIDGILQSELGGKDYLYTKMEKLKVLSGTWNVAQGRASHDSLISWLGSVAADVSIIAVGLQEVEMGAGFLAMSAAKETVGLEGSTAGQWWLDMMGKTLDEGSSFERVGSRQLAGLLIAVWIRNDIRGHVGDVDVAAVPCGFGRAIGNKGAVGLRMRVYGRIMCFVNCHFAAHLEAISRRNADFDHVWRTMAFSKPSNVLNTSNAGIPSSVQMLRGANTFGNNSVDGMPELSEADMVVFFGDFNYRLNDTSYDDARDFISQRSFDWLKERDQLRTEMKAGNVFQGMREAIIKFPPTYKFDKHQPGLAGYDSSEKRRIPAWCDRILYRDTRSSSVTSCSLDCPVVSSVRQYEACMDVTDSDHKPVRAIFSVEIARVDESTRRQEFGRIISCNKNIASILGELCKVPDTIVSTNNIILQNEETSILRISNRSGKKDALFQVICEGQSMIRKDGQASDHHPRGSFGSPRWLQVSPACGIIKPNQIMEISVNHEKYHTMEEFVDGVPKNWWCEDARDKEVILVIKVRGNCSIESRPHRIRVRHSSCGRHIGKEIKSNSNLIHTQANLLRSNFQSLSYSSAVVDQLQNLHSP